MFKAPLINYLIIIIVTAKILHITDYFIGTLKHYNYITLAL